MNNAMNNLFTVSTAEQPTDPRWLYVTPQKSVHAPDWSEGARTLFCYTFTALKHAIAYLDLFDAVDDLAPPKPFDPVPHVFQCSECVFCDGKCAASWERLFGWKICPQDGLYIETN